MAARSSSNESLSRLALSCSALARSGQILSTVSSPAAARAALLQAAEILEVDFRKSGWAQIEQAANECRSVAGTATEADLIVSCRRLATNLARQASSLATEVQQQTRKAPKHGTQPVVTVPTPGPAPLAPVTPPASPPAPAPTAAPKPASAPVPRAKPATPVPAQPAAPKATPEPVVQPVSARASVRDADLARVTVATSAIEREGVAAALQVGDRFAVIGSELIIDVKQNRMWLSRLGPTGSYRTAREFVDGLRGAAYSDWRLPRPDEVQQLLGAGGRDWAIAHGLLPSLSGSTAPACVWTSESRWAWLRFRKEVTVIALATGAIAVVPASNPALSVLAVR
jgi:hypothetical protein